MAAGWSVLDALNKNSKAAAEDNKPKARFRTRDISIDKMYSNDRNFYSMSAVEELADTIRAVGLIENMAVAYDPCEHGEYRIISGEKRWRALKLLVKSGHEEFQTATCQILTPAERHEETVQLIIANAYRNKTIRDQLEEASHLKESLQYMRDHGLTLQGISMEGKIRDVVARIMRTSSTKIAQIDSINNNLIPEYREQLMNNQLTFSAAYELSGMSEEDQRWMLEQYEAETLSLREVRAAKEEKQQGTTPDEDEQIPGQMTYPQDYERDGTLKEDREEDTDDRHCESEPGSEPDSTGQEEPDAQDPEDWQQANPESVLSICYSCKYYTKCEEKTATCGKCNRYVNKAETEKTEEQRYDEEQAAIDRDTRAKLREMEQEEKMQHLPSDAEEQKHYIRVSRDTFSEIMGETGIYRTYLILKNEEYKIGMVLEALEFGQGRATGRTVQLEIVCIDTEDTASALEEGFCVIGFLAHLADKEGRENE